MIYNILFDYQKQLVDYLTQFKATGLFSDTGTGKSYMSIAMYQKYKYIDKAVDKCLIICLAGKIEEWENDFRKYEPFSRILILDTSYKTLKEYRSGKWDIAIVNFEKTWRIEDLYAYTTPRTHIIIDESHKIKNATTKQGKFIGQLGVRTPYKTILTATPSDSGYIDMYNQLYFLGYLNMNKKQFEDYFCTFTSVFIPGMKPFKKIAGYRNVEVLDKIVSSYCRYFKREVNNKMIPSEVVVHFKLNKLYNKIAKERVYNDIVLDSVSSKRVALKSLCSGSIMGRPLIVDEKNPVKVYQLDEDKIKWVLTYLETFNKRVVIFYNYSHQMEQLYQAISKTKRTVARYNAEFKEKDLFTKNEDCVILVQYKSGGTGIDWLKLSYVGIFYSLPDSYIEFYQAKGRIDRYGQENKPLFYILIANGKNSVDEMNYKALLNKTDFNDEFFSKNFNMK